MQAGKTERTGSDAGRQNGQSGRLGSPVDKRGRQVGREVSKPVDTAQTAQTTGAHHRVIGGHNRRPGRVNVTTPLLTPNPKLTLKRPESPMVLNRYTRAHATSIAISPRHPPSTVSPLTTRSSLPEKPVRATATIASPSEPLPSDAEARACLRSWSYCLFLCRPQATRRKGRSYISAEAPRMRSGRDLGVGLGREGEGEGKGKGKGRGKGNRGRMGRGRGKAPQAGRATGTSRSAGIAMYCSTNENHARPPGVTRWDNKLVWRGRTNTIAKRHTYHH